MKDYFFPWYTHIPVDVCSMHVLARNCRYTCEAHIHRITSSSVNLNIKRINAFLIFDVNKVEIFLLKMCEWFARVMCLLSYDENVPITIIS